MAPTPKSLFHKLGSKGDSTSQSKKVWTRAYFEKQQQKEFKQWQKDVQVPSPSNSDRDVFAESGRV